MRADGCWLWIATKRPSSCESSCDGLEDCHHRPKYTLEKVRSSNSTWYPWFTLAMRTKQEMGTSVVHWRYFLLNTTAMQSACQISLSSSVSSFGAIKSVFTKRFNPTHVCLFHGSQSHATPLTSLLVKSTVVLLFWVHQHATPISDRYEVSFGAVHSNSLYPQWMESPPSSRVKPWPGA